MRGSIITWFFNYLYRSVMYRICSIYDGGCGMTQLFLLVLLGSSLLVFAEERQWQPYVKLALYLFVTTYVLTLFA